MANLKLLKKKALITGVNGLLGQKLVEVFLKDFDVLGLGIKENSLLSFDRYRYTRADITKRKEIFDLVKAWQPDYVVNSAAYTNVDLSEDERETCWKVNVTGVENLAAATKKVHAFMIHVSTDYIFDGKTGNYSETSKPNPLGYYGKSKLAGENALIGSGCEYAIARTMVLYGTGINLKPNFATWLVEKLQQGEKVNIVDDQFGHPTIVDDLALAILKIAKLKRKGVFHVTGSECDSRYHFALKLAEVFGLDSDLISRIKTKDLKQKAPRPLNSSFNLDKLHNEIGFKLSNIEEGLRKLKTQMTNSKI